MVKLILVIKIDRSVCFILQKDRKNEENVQDRGRKYKYDHV